MPAIYHEGLLSVTYCLIISAFATVQMVPGITTMPRGFGFRIELKYLILSFTIVNKIEYIP